MVASDLDSDHFGAVSYRIVSGNEANIFRIDRVSGEIFVSKPSLLSSRTQPHHKLNISASDGGGLRSSQNAVVYINVIDSMHRPPIFEKTRYTYSVSTFLLWNFCLLIETDNQNLNESTLLTVLSGQRRCGSWHCCWFRFGNQQ